jgi:hypothetical protein
MFINAFPEITLVDIADTLYSDFDRPVIRLHNCNNDVLEGSLAWIRVSGIVPVSSANRFRYQYRRVQPWISEVKGSRPRFTVERRKS